VFFPPLSPNAFRYNESDKTISHKFDFSRRYASSLRMDALSMCTKVVILGCK